VFLDKETHMSPIKYLKETMGEMKYVQWPTQRQTITYTILVVVISIITALYLGLFDFLFSTLIKFLSR